MAGFANSRSYRLQVCVLLLCTSHSWLLCRIVGMSFCFVLELCVSMSYLCCVTIWPAICPRTLSRSRVLVAEKSKSELPLRMKPCEQASVPTQMFLTVAVGPVEQSIVQNPTYNIKFHEFLITSPNFPDSRCFCCTPPNIPFINER